MIQHIDYEKLGCERSKYNRIFQSLTSEFNDAAGVRSAEELVKGHIDNFALAYRGESWLRNKLS